MRVTPALLALSLLAVAGCRDHRRVPPTIEPALDSASPASSSPGAASLVAPPPPTCAHHRPFAGPDAPPLTLPAPFDAFTPCDVLGVVHIDYDRATEKSAAGGTARIDAAQRWDTAGRTLLAVVYYLGDDAEVGFVCGSCRVAAHLAVVERVDGKLALVASGVDPWKPNVDALFDGRAALDAAQYPFTATDTLLGVRTPWSTGTPGVWTSLALYRLDGATLTIVFESQVAWAAGGMGKEDDDEVDSAPSFEPRADGPSDLRLKNTETRCKPDASTPVCGKPQQLGAERWRFDGKQYQRVEGRKAPLPRILHKLWGW